MLQEEEEEERALDLQMEIDRIRALEAYEERECQRLHESQVGAQILADQILDRQKERVRQEELRELVSIAPSADAANAVSAQIAVVLLRINT